MDRWWANCIRNEEERAWIGATIKKVRDSGEAFARKDYEKALQRRFETGKFEEASA